MSLDLRRVADAAAVECERQQVGLPELVLLLAAYEFVYEVWSWPEDEGYEFNIGNVLQLGAHIDPEKANKLRHTPVVFQNGGTSANHQDIFDLLKARIEDLNNDQMTVEQFIREFLWIHPFEDGNGRTAWVLQNWLNETMDAPEPLKEYDW